MRIKVVTRKPHDGKELFSSLEAGEFFISEGGYVGVKTAYGGILWLTGPATGRMVEGDFVSPDKRYQLPVSVTIVVNQ